MYGWNEAPLRGESPAARHGDQAKRSGVAGHGKDTWRTNCALPDANRMALPARLAVLRVR